MLDHVNIVAPPLGMISTACGVDQWQNILRPSRPKRGYATTLVYLKRNKVFDVVLGSSEASLRQYLKALLGRDKVRLIVMDISEAYRAIARQNSPNAMIVADRFHVMASSIGFSEIRHGPR